MSGYNEEAILLAFSVPPMQLGPPVPSRRFSYVRHLMELGHLNEPCSTVIDREAVLRLLGDVAGDPGTPGGDA